ncbi:hypothetical protein DOTSEDRAFT_23863 [Dothistroma septosporum NZE10]|uniref:FAD/NAD(P)-binding domain-containing protein n=1 Tax=Dothistroma septosporum (strain NZE10 / CBS 128990) TaxID=675120 RepID=N1PK77_DOTSN|nr:hypothetical protein DOTSEDRAFT_23863 [Dothistroma septosporum NZE10]
MSMNEQDVDVIVIGAGFGGCYLLHKLRASGFSVKVLEAGSTLGGVWCWNRYPGARVDCEFPYYGFSDPAVWSTFEWTERFPSDKELRAYFEHVAEVWDLHRDIQLETRVVEARYQEHQNQWHLRTAASSKTWKCRWLIAATGTSFKQHIPEWRGRENFEGILHHSALWPENIEIEGKKVAVIGAGSTGVQIVQEASKVSQSVTQFIRSPNFALPMRQRKISEEERYSYLPQMPHVFRACRSTRSGLPTQTSDRKVFDDSAETRESRLEHNWKRGGFNWYVNPDFTCTAADKQWRSQGSYGDYMVDAKANREMYDFWRKKTLERISDPVKRDILAPEEPPYYISTKRPSLEQDYYESCDRSNVEITNTPIVEFTKTGIVTEDGKERDFDIVAVCTGYDAVTGGLRTMGIKGRKGLDLDEKWSDGIVTNLGMMVNGFPNFFMVYGPQAPTSLSNGPIFLEIQGDYILRVLLRQREEGIASIEADKQAEQAWRTHVLDLAERTLLVKTDSWYMGANIPGKRREYLIYPGGLPLYQEKMEEALKDWKGYALSSSLDSVRPSL